MPLQEASDRIERLVPKHIQRVFELRRRAAVRQSGGPQFIHRAPRRRGVMPLCRIRGLHGASRRDRAQHSWSMRNAYPDRQGRRQSQAPPETWRFAETTLRKPIRTVCTVARIWRTELLRDGAGYGPRRRGPATMSPKPPSTMTSTGIRDCRRIRARLRTRWRICGRAGTRRHRYRPLR